MSVREDDLNMPKWVYGCKDTDKLFDALALAWEALDSVADENHDSPRGVVYDSKEAMRRIEELGK